MSDLAEDRMPKIQNALVIGELKSDGDANFCPLIKQTIGIVTPRTENFFINGVKFYDFDNLNNNGDLDGAALRTCSGCELDST